MLFQVACHSVVPQGGEHGNRPTAARRLHGTVNGHNIHQKNAAHLTSYMTGRFGPKPVNSLLLASVVSISLVSISFR
jgi:hypothetical protein